MSDIFPETAARVAEWAADPEVLGVVLVGSKSRGHDDHLSDDDLEVILTPEAFARRSVPDCYELCFSEETPPRLLYDMQYMPLPVLEAKAASPFDLDRWPYERAPVLFDRDGRVGAAVAAAGRMDGEFRRLRLLHATVDAGSALRRAEKTLARGAGGSTRLLLARAAKAFNRLIFALEHRWVPLDHWLEAELRTLEDPTGGGEALLETLATGRPEPLLRALARLEDRLAAEGVPRPPDRRQLFWTLIHPSNASERALHGLS